MFLFNSLGIFAVTVYRRGLPQLTQHLLAGWRIAFLGAAMSMTSYGIVLWAMTQTSIPAVAALRETSVIFAALLGAWFLKERMGPWRIAGAMVVSLGAITIRLG
jgi:drug/metabolite transporter (DMT)-like permease